MKRIERICDYNEREYEKRFLTEPGSRLPFLWERISDIIKTYEPGVIVKAGLGSGEVVKKICENFPDIALVVVEPSGKLIRTFLKECPEMEEKVRFINGDFKNFPIDYYGADLIISIDNINILESSPVMDEFKRALEFEGHIFLAGVVLDDEDFDGLYDEYMKTILPIHNDYYLHNDLKTFMSLKEFSFIKGKVDFIDLDLEEQYKYLASAYDLDSNITQTFIDENHEKFEQLYELKGKTLRLPYFSGLFMRKKVNTHVQV